MSQQKILLSPPCNIVIHPEVRYRCDADTNNAAVPSLAASGLAGSELLPPTRKGSNCSHGSCMGAGRTNGSNHGRRVSRNVGPLSKKAMDVITDSAVPRGWVGLVGNMAQKNQSGGAAKP